MKHLTKLTSRWYLPPAWPPRRWPPPNPDTMTVLTPNTNPRSMKKPVSRPPEACKHKAEHPMKKALKHAAKKMPKHHHHHHGR